MSRASRLPAKAILLLAGWFFACLLCQAYPETAQAHHMDSSGLDRGCPTVAEASPISSAYLLVVGSARNIDHTYDPASLSPPSPAGISGGIFAAFQRNTTSLWSPTSSKLYQLNRVYRL